MCAHVLLTCNLLILIAQTLHILGKPFFWRSSKSGECLIKIFRASPYLQCRLLDLSIVDKHLALCHTQNDAHT